VRPVSVLAVVLVVAACGASPHSTQALAAELEAAGLLQARQDAPDLVALAEHALEAARDAELAGDEAVASDWATIARSYASAALSERERFALERERASLERERLELERHALALETEARTLEQTAERRDAVRVLERELLAAEQRAIEDEASPRRMRRLATGDAETARRAAAAIGERARLMAAAAVAMGASPTLASERIEAPLAGHQGDVAVADSAYRAARMLLAEARAGQETPSSAEGEQLLDEARLAELAPARTERGIVLSIASAFRGAALTASGATRVGLAARILVAHPHAGISIEASTPERAELVRRSLIAAGVTTPRIGTVQASAADELRIVVVGY
jgi:hypothetical protein